MSGSDTAMSVLVFIFLGGGVVLFISGVVSMNEYFDREHYKQSMNMWRLLGHQGEPSPQDIRDMWREVHRKSDEERRLQDALVDEQRRAWRNRHGGP